LPTPSRSNFVGRANVADPFDGEMIATNVLLLDFERIRGYKLSRHVQNTCAFDQPYLTAVSRNTTKFKRKTEVK